MTTCCNAKPYYDTNFQGTFRKISEMITAFTSYREDIHRILNGKESVTESMRGAWAREAYDIFGEFGALVLLDLANASDMHKVRLTSNLLAAYAFEGETSVFEVAARCNYTDRSLAKNALRDVFNFSEQECTCPSAPDLTCDVDPWDDSDYEKEGEGEGEGENEEAEKFSGGDPDDFYPTEDDGDDDDYTYYDRTGSQISYETWGYLQEDVQYRQVQRTEVGLGENVATILTVWNGVRPEGTLIDDYPRIFETRVYTEDLDFERQVFHATDEGARRGHFLIVGTTMGDFYMKEEKKKAEKGEEKVRKEEKGKSSVSTEETSSVTESENANDSDRTRSFLHNL